MGILSTMVEGMIREALAQVGVGLSLEYFCRISLRQGECGTRSITGKNRGSSPVFYRYLLHRFIKFGKCPR